MTTPDDTTPPHRADPDRIAILGAGYAGLPVGLAFAEAGQTVRFYDVNEQRVAQLNAGESYIEDIPRAKLATQVEAGRLDATADPSDLKGFDAYLICVPTPLGIHREPDMSYVQAAADVVADAAGPGALIVLESTTYPGTTEEVLGGALRAQGRVIGEDVFLAYSPERVDPGNKSWGTANTPKVVGGSTQACLERAAALYGTVAKEVVEVSSTEVAEATKLLENIYRSVNIALVNELKVLFDRMDIDVWEVIQAAATKPYGFQAFYPGPGLGGHCIPIDPFYLSWKAREYDLHTRFIELAGEINTTMPRFVLEKVIDALNADGKALHGANVLLLGVAYKGNVGDTRESPALRLMELLASTGATVTYHDPHVPTLHARQAEHLAARDSVTLDAATLQAADVVVLVTDHEALDHDLVLEHAARIVDTRNAFPADHPRVHPA